MWGLKIAKASGGGVLRDKSEKEREVIPQPKVAIKKRKKGGICGTKWKGGKRRKT